MSNKQSRTIGNPGVVKAIHREVRFGSYILGSTLGEGEFGKVKLGWRKDGKNPSQVAIKLIKRADIAKDSENEVKIHREINSLKLLNHPNIVTLVEVMKSEKYIGIVLEYASGGELFDYILQNKHLKENVAKRIFAQLVSGVDYMHSKGLIHRDLKLENLLLDKHKNVIISDFGFVNSYNKDRNDLMKTSCGSPCYAAPELVLTQQPYEGRKVDIWSLGVILFAMLSGYLPFDDDPENEDGEDIVRLYHYICKTPLTFPEYVTPLARDLLRKIIVPDPRKRINIDDIRNHPWLTPHVNLLSIRQIEWDRISSEKHRNKPPLTAQVNKRFSMINEKTSNSLAIMQRGKIQSAVSNDYRIYSSSVRLASSSSSSSSSSQPNALSISMNNESYETGRKTPSPTKRIASGSPNMATTYQSKGYATTIPTYNSFSSASNVLKAVVTENESKRNSMSSVDMPYVQMHSSARSHGASQSAKLMSYNNSNFSTIVESPTKNAGIDSIKAEPHNAPGSFFHESTKTLPHTTRRPRPTSYHPSSMSSSFNTIGVMSPQNTHDFTKIPSNLTAVTPLSRSPTKGSSPVKEGHLHTYMNSAGSCSTLGIVSDISNHSRRDSIVTHVNVNGVLSGDLNSTENKRNSVLSYLEDKMDAMDLVDARKSLGASDLYTDETAKTVKVESHDKSVINMEATSSDESNSAIVESNPHSAVSQEKKIKLDSNAIDLEKYDHSEHSKSDSLAKSPSSRETYVTGDMKSTGSMGRHSKPHAEKAQKYPLNKVKTEEQQQRETKKKNRFSLLSLYNSYNGSSSNITLQSAPKSSNSGGRKVLEPSTEANIAPRTNKDPKRIASSSVKSSISSHSNSTQNSNNRQSSAAKKVMDFFKRRSVRIS